MDKQLQIKRQVQQRFKNVTSNWAKGQIWGYPNRYILCGDSQWQYMFSKEQRQFMLDNKYVQKKKNKSYDSKLPKCRDWACNMYKHVWMITKQGQKFSSQSIKENKSMNQRKKILIQKLLTQMKKKKYGIRQGIKQTKSTSVTIPVKINIVQQVQDDLDITKTVVVWVDDSNSFMIKPLFSKIKKVFRSAQYSPMMNNITISAGFDSTFDKVIKFLRSGNLFN